jgi:serine/threonine protein kinase
VGVTGRLDIGPYRVVRRLALSERNEVLLARILGPHGFQRTVVLKRLIGAQARDPARLRQIAAEAIAYARLSHSAIVRLYDFVELDGAPTLVLEYVPGFSLEVLLAASRERGVALRDDQVFYVGARVFAALAAAHGARHPETGEFSPVIHRDVSPSNVLVSSHGEVKLADFGVARIGGVSEETPAGTLVGTYGYMAPEQILGDGVTVRADVYAAGLLLWEMLAGRHAFDRASLPELEILQAMAQPCIPPIETIRPDLPRDLCHALGRALRVDPDERIAAGNMLDVVREYVHSAEARAGLADELGRARRHAPTIPDAVVASSPPPSPVDLSPDPDATSRHSALPVPELPSQSRPRITSDTPTALAAPVLPAPSPREVARPRRSRWRPALASTLMALLLASPLLAGAVPMPRTARTPTRSHRAQAATATRPEAPAEILADAPPAGGSASPALPTLDPGSGVLETPESMANHRVFVDGVVRGVGGDQLEVRCGARLVRLGSAGRFQWVQVPCGGRVSVMP